MKTLAIIVLFALSGCTTPMHEENTLTKVFFCPQDMCGTVMSKLIGYASQSVHCAFFDLDLPVIIDKLDSQSKKIDVKLVLEGDNYIDLPYARKEARSSYMHNKFCIIDSKIVVTGSFNPTVNGDTKNNNNMIVIRSRLLAENFMDEFDELWNRTFGRGDMTDFRMLNLDGKIVENYFCPEDNCRQKVKQAIGGANESIYFMLFSFTDGGIATDLIRKQNQGVAVEGIFEKRNAQAHSVFNLLKYQGIDVRLDSNPYSMHHKVFVIDEKTVITGSFNPSVNANTYNDENILIIHDEYIAGEYLAEYSRLIAT